MFASMLASTDHNMSRFSFSLNTIRIIYSIVKEWVELTKEILVSLLSLIVFYVSSQF